MSLPDAFLESLGSRLLLMDGAMGTELQRRGIKPGECYEEWNLAHPEVVAAIHRDYVDAGAQVLLTNTFQANPIALGRHGLADQINAICEAAIRLARQASLGHCFVVASFGPFDGLTDELDRLLAACRHADAVLFETLSDVLPLESIRRKHAQTPILVSYTYCYSAEGGMGTRSSLTPEAIATEVSSANVAALGVNCGRDIGMDDTIEILRRYRSATSLPLFARPNAGTPKLVKGQFVYPLTPEAMAARIPELQRVGASMLGGCCGTTPQHIAACHLAIDSLT